MPNKIALIHNGRYEEGRADGIMSPGHLVYAEATGDEFGITLRDYAKHAGGRTQEKMFVIEDSLQGRLITDAYADNDLIRIAVCEPGDVMYVRIPIGANVAETNILVSNGDGALSPSAAISGLLYANVADSAAVTNTVTATAFDKSYAIPANTLDVGDIIKVTTQVLATATNSTDTLTITLKIGSTTIIATAAVDVANGDIGTIVAYLSIRTVGASGTFVASGEQSLGVPGTVTGKPFNLVSTAIDTTAAQTLTVVATWSVANAGNSCKLTQLVVEKLAGTGGSSQPVAIALEAVDNSAGSAETFVRARILA